MLSAFEAGKLNWLYEKDNELPYCDISVVNSCPQIVPYIVCVAFAGVGQFSSIFAVRGGGFDVIDV